MSTLTLPARCAKCESLLDAATRIAGDHGRPKAGDISMCLYCGTMHRFTKGLKLRRMTAAEVAVLDADTRAILRQMRRARRELVPG